MDNGTNIIKAMQMGNKNTNIMLVDGISKLTTHSVSTCRSSVFCYFGLKWKLIFGMVKVGSEDCVSLYLRVKDKRSLGPNWEVKCYFRLGIVSQILPQWNFVDLYGNFNEKHAFEGGVKWSVSQMQLNASLDPYLVNDKMVFCVEIIDVKTNFNVTVIPRTMGTAERLRLIEVPRNKSKFTWKITEFSSFKGESHSSYEFTVGPRRWKLEMYPQGNGDGAGNSLSLFLRGSDYVTNGPKAKTLAVFKLRVLDQLHRKHFEKAFHRWFSEDPNRSVWGQTKFLPLEKLKDYSCGLLVKNEIYIGVEFLLLSTTENL